MLALNPGIFGSNRAVQEQGFYRLESQGSSQDDNFKFGPYCSLGGGSFQISIGRSKLGLASAFDEHINLRPTFRKRAEIKIEACLYETVKL